MMVLKKSLHSLFTRIGRLSRNLSLPILFKKQEEQFQFLEVFLPVFIFVKGLMSKWLLFQRHYRMHTLVIF